MSTFGAWERSEEVSVASGEPGLGFGGSSSGFGVSVFFFGFDILVLGFWFLVSGFGFLVSGFGSRDSVFGFRAGTFWFRISGFGFQIPGFGFWIPGFRFRVSGLGAWVSGLTAGNEILIRQRHLQNAVLARAGTCREKGESVNPARSQTRRATFGQTTTFEDPKSTEAGSSYCSQTFEALISFATEREGNTLNKVVTTFTLKMRTHGPNSGPSFVIPCQIARHAEPIVVKKKRSPRVCPRTDDAGRDGELAARMDGC